MSKSYDSVAGLQEELSSFLDDIVELAQSKAGLAGDKLDELKQGLRDRLDDLGSDARDAVSGAARKVSGQAEEALDYVDDYAHEKPWQLVLAAGLIGLAVGVLVSRR